MATSTREQIMSALLTRLQNVCGSTFSTYSRKFWMYDDIVNKLSDASQGDLPRFPFICTYDGVGFGGGLNTWQQRGKGLPVVRIFDVTLVIYARFDGAGTPDGPDQTIAGASILTPLIEAVELAMQPDDPAENTMTLVSILGRQNEVSHCWLEGIGHSIPGDIDPSGLAMQTIPVRIMIP